MNLPDSLTQPLPPAPKPTVEESTLIKILKEVEAPKPTVRFNRHGIRILSNKSKNRSEQKW